MTTLCYLIPAFPGVTHVLFWREVRRLRERGVEVRIASTRRPQQLPPHRFAAEPCFYAWPPTRAVLGGLPRPGQLVAQIRFALGLAEGGWRERLKVLAMLPASWMLASFLRSARIDHLHVHSFADSAYLAALAHLVCGVPYSPVLHGGLRVYGLNHAAKLRHAAFACGVSASMREEIEAVRPGISLPEDIACGVDLETFAFAERAPGDRLRLISVGRMDHCKGIGFTLEAIARLRGEVDVTYTLVGSGPHESDILDHVQRLGLGDRVSFLGPRGQEEVVELLHQHDVAMLTSYGDGETTAIAIREAMASGMPVIMSRVGDAETMIEPEVTGLLVPQTDVDAIGQAIRWFALHRARIPEMGRAARREAERAFGDDVGPARLLRAIEARAGTGSQASRGGQSRATAPTA